MKFEGTCGTCKTRITGNWTWRHDRKPADKHQARPVGTISQI